MLDVKLKHLLLATLTVALIAADKPNGKKEDKDVILGTWNFQSGERDGTAPSDEIRSLKLTFKEDKVTLTTRDETLEHKYQLDPSRKPRQIALTVTENGVTKTYRGIYDLDGDSLRMCFPVEAERDPPRDFSGTKDSKQTFLFFRRSK
jgi:uncharacterized protein (TIGR03067 family)